MKRLIVGLLITLVLLIAVFSVKEEVLGGSYVKLQSEPVYVGLSSSLINSAYPHYIPIEGKNYSVTSLKYFYGQTWVVADIQAIDPPADTVIVVLHETGGKYVSVLGPANSLKGAYLNDLPKDVANYLESK